jgi:cell division protein FtsA
MGVVVCDIGGGTTDMAIYIDGDVWHTMVLAVGGNHITSDIATLLRLPISQAEEIKKQFGSAMADDIKEDEFFPVKAFGEDAPVSISHKELAQIIEARAEEIFVLLLQEIKRSGYDGLLPAGMVLTGGTSNLPKIRQLASRVLNLPVRIAKPEGLIGLTDQLHSPAYSTSVGLLYWALMMNEAVVPNPRRITQHSGSGGGGGINWSKLKEWIRRLLP